MMRRDLSAVFNTADFGVPAISDRYGSIVGVFRNGEFETEHDYGRQVIRTQSIFVTKSAYGITAGDTLEIGEHTYRVEYPVDDGNGVTRLYLELTDAG